MLKNRLTRYKVETLSYVTYNMSREQRHAAGFRSGCLPLTIEKSRYNNTPLRDGT